MLKARSFLCALGIVLAMALLFSPDSRAQASAAAGSTATPAASADGATGVGFAITPQDVTNAFIAISNQVQQVSQSIIGIAVSTTSTLNSESDKISGGLAVLVVVLTFAEFAGTHHPVGAWVKVFMNLMVLGMFATVYVGYATAAPGFYNWFVTLANDLNGGQPTIQALGNAAGSVLLGMKHSTDGLGFTDLTNGSKILTIIIIDFAAAFCFLMMCVSGVVFIYYTLVGVVQAGIGIVFGKIAIALGFHQMTRNFFSSWLSFMIHAGMYTAVSAAMNALVIKTFITTLQSNTPSGTLNFSTSFASVIALTVISLFILLLSMEIPKIAGMFGSGASGGAKVVNKAASAATMRALG
ncbi:type IV secretion system protein [Paraburkholderia domus]|uniref:type IV secretion system protein n=1 Tax=Paraburkholderia domus TaxID=2793075 RepID=UPI00191156C2|nr:type IV secretion system protein [Paraburkholderia domus]MBK5065782.1 type IV secretion system protein [Burkholderia sp. R-70199]CAE6963061.1 hypothetical protein R70199_07469 [Paraburkholderia domus]